MKDIKRRAFLRNGTVAMTLPLLKSFGFSDSLSSAKSISVPTGIPKRLIFLAMGYGVTGENWYPDTSQRDTNFELPESLTPLRPFKDDISIIQNLYHRQSKQGHWGTTFWLTGANRYGVPGKKFHNTVSVDQVAAEKFGRETRFTSLRLNGAVHADGHGPGSSASWNRNGVSLSAHQSLVELYSQLFSVDQGSTMEERLAGLKKHQSVLDAVMSDAHSLNKGLTQTDVEKLDEYFESIRQIETRLEKESDWIDVPKRVPSGTTAPSAKLSGVESVEAAFDLMVSAMQVDATRVFTYKLPIQSILPELTDTSISAHSMSHYGDPASLRGKVSTLRDQTNAKLLAGLIGKLKSTKEVDGSSLFDHTTVVYGGNLSVTHNLRNCPTLITGRGAGLKLGHHFVMNDRTPLCDLWLSILNGIGLPEASFGDSNGIMQKVMV